MSLGMVDCMSNPTGNALAAFAETSPASVRNSSAKADEIAASAQAAVKELVRRHLKALAAEVKESV